MARIRKIRRVEQRAAKCDIEVAEHHNFFANGILVHNCTMYSDGSPARSIDSRHHPSRDWLKSLQGRVGHLIPAGWRVCGENMYALHSLGYDKLPSYFLVFSIWNEKNECLSWDDTVEWCELLGLTHVPVLKATSSGSPMASTTATSRRDLRRLFVQATFRPTNTG